MDIQSLQREWDDAMNEGALRRLEEALREAANAVAELHVGEDKSTPRKKRSVREPVPGKPAVDEFTRRRAEAALRRAGLVGTK